MKNEVIRTILSYIKAGIMSVGIFSIFCMFFGTYFPTELIIPTAFAGCVIKVICTYAG